MSSHYSLHDLENTLQQPLQGAIISKLGELTLSVVNDLSNPSRYTIKQLVDVLEKDPTVYACSLLKTARAIELLGEYHNETKKDLQKWVRSNLANMEGTVEELTSRLSSADALGFSAAEWKLKKKGSSRFSEWQLAGFNYLNPEHTTFRAKGGNVLSVRYRDGSREKKVPIWKLLHVTGGSIINFGERSVYGSPSILRAYPYIKLKQLIFAEMGISAKRLATGLVVGQADSSQLVQEKGKDGKLTGKYVSPIENLSKQLSFIQNHGTIVTDKQNSISALQLPAGEQFWNLAKNMVDEQIMRSMLVPQMIWSEGSGALGIGALSQTQHTILDTSVKQMVKQIEDALIEKLIKPLIIWNFGVQEDYGHFERKKSSTPDQESIVTQNLITSLSMGLVPQSDIDGVNALRERLELPLIDPQKQMMQAQIQAQLQALQQGVPAQAEQPEQDPLLPGESEELGGESENAPYP